MQYCLSIVANAISNIKQYLFVNNFMQCRIQRQKKIGMDVTTSTTSLLELSNAKPTESMFSLHTLIFEIVYYLNLDLTFLNSSYSFEQNSNQKIIGLNQTLKQKYVFN